MLLSPGAPSLIIQLCQFDRSLRVSYSRKVNDFVYVSSPVVHYSNTTSIKVPSPLQS